jgi:hypothetical protein
MWIVRLALRRTYTFVAAAVLIAVLGAVSIYRMSTGIFPNIDVPASAWCGSVQPLPLNFLLQQAALQSALQQTRALQQASLQRNPTLSRLALRPLNTLEAVQQQSLALQNALQTQNNLLTPGQLLQLSQEQPTMAQQLISQPIPVPRRTPGASGR